jgi:hypothetical protein
VDACVIFSVAGLPLRPEGFREEVCDSEVKDGVDEIGAVVEDQSEVASVIGGCGAG